MKSYRVVVDGKEYTVNLVEDRGNVLVLDVNGKQVVVELGATTAPIPAATETSTPVKTAEPVKNTVQTQPSASRPAGSVPSAPSPVPAPAPKPSTAQPAPGLGIVTSKVPGKILKVLVGEGQSVQENQTILTMESMKMEIEIKSPKTGRVSKILVKPGDYVEPGQQMMVIE